MTSADSLSAAGFGLNGRYQAGVCNIGGAEVALRRRSGHVATIATAALFAGLVAVRAPRPWRILVAVPAAGAASGYLQARSHFCAGLAARGLYNFGPLGHATLVMDDDAHAADVASARRLGRQSLAIGLAVGVVAGVIPVQS